MLKSEKSIEKRPLSIIPKSTLNTQAPGTSIFLVAKNKVPAPACSCIFWNTLKITTAGQIRTLLCDGSGLFLSLEGGMSEYLGVKSSYSLFCCGTKSCFVTLLLLLKLSCISQGRQFFQLEFPYSVGMLNNKKRSNKIYMIVLQGKLLLRFNFNPFTGLTILKTRKTFWSITFFMLFLKKFEEF